MASKWIVKIVLILAVVGGMMYLGRVGAADFLRLEPCTYLDSLNAKNELPAPDKLEKARERLLLAQRIDPSNPIIPEYLGQIYSYRALLTDFDPQLQLGFLELALENYELAIKLRPNSGYLWSSVMLTRHTLREVVAQSTSSPVAASSVQGDIEPLRVSLRNAAQLAPWEPSVIGAVIQVGRLHYAEMGASDQMIVDKAIERANKLGIKL